MEQKRLLRAGLMERLEGRMQVDDGELQEKVDCALMVSLELST